MILIYSSGALRMRKIPDYQLLAKDSKNTSLFNGEIITNLKTRFNFYQRLLSVLLRAWSPAKVTNSFNYEGDFHWSMKDKCSSSNRRAFTLMIGWIRLRKWTIDFSLLRIHSIQFCEMKRVAMRIITGHWMFGLPLIFKHFSNITSIILHVCKEYLVLNVKILFIIYLFCKFMGKGKR